jgi:hypothetical protein
MISSAFCRSGAALTSWMMRRRISSIGTAPLGEMRLQ